MDGALQPASDILSQGGVTIWIIAALSILTAALILWKLIRFARSGAWAGATTEQAVQLWIGGEPEAAQQLLANRPALRTRLATAAMAARMNPAFSPDDAREETERVARAALMEARSGLRALELIATIAPLLGLLGTVLGMIAAFQALQEAGTRADPAALAGGIWEALLTTAAGMAVAIPASMTLTWFESIVERVQSDMEDAATRIFTHTPPRLATLRAAE
ncbi:MotA/TolQ/ExbB proton channel family protein [Pontivivens ytuae]|uniref:MotA/TolQ/ExbB proton channel family protein n=1 Tax=Pontivivens ytuae TaxID=2789856 RepID=A0A7S9LUD8_9RHOB|nr:MotA/TolQ/ExbB proton channel family protein [Pontivivens ytuae]QPH55348.1 MotA/TolQ/ExbB proton channel family protein [Pontivivens ytuae]